MDNEYERVCAGVAAVFDRTKISVLSSDQPPNDRRDFRMASAPGCSKVRRCSLLAPSGVGLLFRHVRVPNVSIMSSWVSRKPIAANRDAVVSWVRITPDDIMTPPGLSLNAGRP